MIKSGLKLAGIVFIFLMGCREREDYKEVLASSELLIQANEKLTDVIVHDIFSPPVASRIYAYPAIAAYEVAVLAEPDRFISLMGQLNGAQPLDIALEPEEDYSFPLASLTAFYGVAHKLVFSEQDMIDHKEAVYERIKNAGISNSQFQNSVELGQAVADHILKYASEDNYHQSRSFEKYTIKNDPSTWKPTPPAYMEGIEPHWNKIRPFILDSSNQFSPLPPPPFDTVPESKFFLDAKMVMDSGNNLNKAQTDIAYFWDCNPYKMNVKGHVMYAEKKITPGGHWIGIAGIASKTKGLDWKETTETMAVTSLYLFDGFISCWDEKYRSVLIRPETYINLHMDEDWVPLLQTPPFPEYTSGHSVISTAASFGLTRMLGEPFHFVDSTEMKYGLGIREFDSFREAAEEAAISRFYGGIHYMPAIEQGIEQGRMVAEHIAQKINTRKVSLASNQEKKE